MQKIKKTFIFLLTLVVSLLFVACDAPVEPRSPITVVSDHGTVSIDNEFPARWDRVTATITPEEGYMIEKVTLNGVNYTAKLKNNKFTFDFTEETYSIVVTYSPLPTLESAIDFNVEIESGRESRARRILEIRI